ncbi:ABC transporter permease [Maritimibacter alkaliphilus]|uniref:ABC transporter permease n=1 Tax=Maritimibacter alkaliphilus TaxID=404236 RepID=UPI001C97CACA|nr:ABC transporter permease [Maritimibacter alkaliphilus]MBY6092860.1 ABC transporter permease [Maritimibacter alkaliphilus]
MTNDRLLRVARPVLLPTLTAAVLLGIWWALASWADLPAVVLPHPADVWSILKSNFPLLSTHMWHTAYESTLGFLIAMVTGVSLAILITYSAVLREAFYPHLILFQLVPKVALAPLFVVWLGIGAPARLSFATFIAFFPLVIATAQGLTEVPPEMIRLSRSLSATRWQIFRTIRFPYAIPYIFAGMKISVTMAMIGIIVGEFIASQKGLGYLILFASSQANTALILAAVILLCVVGLVQFGIVLALERAVRRVFGSD